MANNHDKPTNPPPAINDPAYWREEFTQAANERDRIRAKLHTVNNYLTNARRRISQLIILLRDNGVTIPAPLEMTTELHAQSVATESLIQGVPLLLEPGAITIAGWSPSAPGTANATMTEVHAMFAVPELDATFVVTFASPHTLSTLIDSLTEYRDAVWPGTKQ